MLLGTHGEGYADVGSCFAMSRRLRSSLRRKSFVRTGRTGVASIVGNGIQSTGRCPGRGRAAGVSRGLERAQRSRWVFDGIRQKKRQKYKIQRDKRQESRHRQPSYQPRPGVEQGRQRRQPAEEQTGQRGERVRMTTEREAERGWVVKLRGWEERKEKKKGLNLQTGKVAGERRM